MWTKQSPRKPQTAQETLNSQQMSNRRHSRSIRAAAWARACSVISIPPAIRATSSTRAAPSRLEDFADTAYAIVQDGRMSMEAGAAWEAAARQDLVDLAMAIARRVVRHVSESDRQVVVGNLDEAIRLAGERSDVTIKVNPADAEAARVFAESLADRQASCKLVKVVESPDISPGGCWIQWGSGAVDARIETQLDRIAAGLGSREMQAADKPAPNTAQEGPVNT